MISVHKTLIILGVSICLSGCIAITKNDPMPRLAPDPIAIVLGVGSYTMAQYGSSDLVDQLSGSEQLLAKNATREALSGGDGTKVSWKSRQNSRVKGFVQIVGDGFEKNGTSCKTVRELVQIEGSEESGISEYCLIENTWQLSPS